MQLDDGYNDEGKLEQTLRVADHILATISREAEVEYKEELDEIKDLVELLNEIDAFTSSTDEDDHHELRRMSEDAYDALEDLREVIEYLDDEGAIALTDDWLSWDVN